MLGMAAIRDRHTGRVEGAVARAALDAGHSPLHLAGSVRRNGDLGDELCSIATPGNNRSYSTKEAPSGRVDGHGYDPAEISMCVYRASSRGACASMAARVMTTQRGYRTGF